MTDKTKNMGVHWEYNGDLSGFNGDRMGFFTPTPYDFFEDMGVSQNFRLRPTIGIGNIHNYKHFFLLKNVAFMGLWPHVPSENLSPFQRFRDAPHTVSHADPVNFYRSRWVNPSQVELSMRLIDESWWIHPCAKMQIQHDCRAGTDLLIELVPGQKKRFGVSSTVFSAKLSRRL